MKTRVRLTIAACLPAREVRSSSRSWRKAAAETSCNHLRNLGKGMVARYVESRGGTASNPERRWEVFEPLLSSPRLPSALGD